MNNEQFEAILDQLDSMPEVPAGFKAEVDQRMASVDEDISGFLDAIMEPCDDPECSDPKMCHRGVVNRIILRLIMEGPEVTLLYLRGLVNALVRERHGQDSI